MRTASTLLFLTILAVFGLSACSDSTSPGNVPRMNLTLNTVAGMFEGEPYFRIEAAVTNTGRQPVLYPFPCRFTVPIGVTDDQGTALALRNPTIDIVCPPAILTLEPRESVRTDFDLIWAYNLDGTTYRVPPGDYTVSASFSYFWEKDMERQHLEEEMAVVLE